jgi:acetylglutamate kinase
MLTDVAGVLGQNGQLINEISLAEAKDLINDGTISGGMIPKIETCMQAVKGDVEAAVVIDGRVEHALLIELFTEGGVGTLIK